MSLLIHLLVTHEEATSMLDYCHAVCGVALGDGTDTPLDTELRGCAGPS